LRKFEFCDAKWEWHIDDYMIYGQSPSMLVCEKLRAICQQMDDYRSTVSKHRAFRARDFLDIQITADFYAINFTDAEFQEILQETFAAKRVPLNLLGKIDSEREFHRENFETVRQIVKPDFALQEYDFYVDFVVERCRDLEPLWNE